MSKPSVDQEDLREHTDTEECWCNPEVTCYPGAWTHVVHYRRTINGDLLPNQDAGIDNN